MIDRVESALGVRVVSSDRAAGGCIADSLLVDLEDGRRVFVKTVTHAPESLLAEARGLRELFRAAERPRIPEVLHAESGLLVLEAIDSGTPATGGWERLGREFAALHHTTRETFGFDEDNWIGATPQQNEVSDNAAHDWPTFYAEARLLPQLRLAEQNGFATPEFLRVMDRLVERLPDLLAGTEEPPALLHGDLWGGNLMWDADGGPVLIDPAVYYGHREADLAMTFLFGGFTPAFYAAYDEAWPLPDGWRERVGLYELYHVLNHLNLFGRSYLAGAIERARRYG